MAETKRNAFELVFDDDEAVRNEVDYFMSPTNEGGLDAETFTEFMDTAPFVEVNPELCALIGKEDYEGFKKKILDDSNLKEKATEYIYDAGDFSDVVASYYEDNLTELNSELHRLLKTPMTQKYHIDGIDKLNENPEFILLGKEVGWKGESFSDKLLLNMDTEPEKQLLDSFSLHGDSRLVLKQEYKHVPALELMRYSHDEPVGASFLVVPYDAAEAVLNLSEFANWKKTLELADKHFKDVGMPDECLMPELSKHTEWLEKISDYNRKIETGDMQLSQPAKEYLLQLTDDFQGFRGGEKLNPFIRLNVFDMESEDNPPHYEYYADAALAKLEKEKGKGYVTEEDAQNLQKEVLRVLPVPLEESVYVRRGFEDASKNYLVPPLKKQVEAGIGKIVEDLKGQGFSLPAIGKALQSASKEATAKLERESSARK